MKFIEIPEKELEISKIIPKESWINPEEIEVYLLKDGTAFSIYDPTTCYIDRNSLEDFVNFCDSEREEIVSIK